MQCTGNSGCFPQGMRAAIDSTALVATQLSKKHLYPVFLSFHTTNCECEAYSFTTDGYGIFNVCTNLGACPTHEGGSGTNKSAQELTRRDRKPPHQGIEPRPCRFEFRRTNHWATSPVVILDSNLQQAVDFFAALCMHTCVWFRNSVIFQDRHSLHFPCAPNDVLDSSFLYFWFIFYGVFPHLCALSMLLQHGFWRHYASLHHHHHHHHHHARVSFFSLKSKQIETHKRLKMHAFQQGLTKIMCTF